MSNKQIVADLLQRIPDGASLHDIAQEIEFVAAVRQGLSELDRGEGIPIEEVARELPSWVPGSKTNSLMIVKLKKKNARYRDLTLGQPYVVIGIEADDLRILNDAGRPFLYPPKLFSLVDCHDPVDWVTEFGDNGERYSYPSSLNKPGFFEDFFDEKAKAVATFWRVVNQRLADSQRSVGQCDEGRQRWQKLIYSNHEQ